MNTTTTLTSKGQVTIPKAIRNALHLKQGVRLEVRIQDQGFFLKPKKRISLMRLGKGSLAQYDDGRPWKEIIAETQRLAAIEIVKKSNRR
jgi:AbrB family looped-hinge helix DNA binding protein